MTMFVRTFQRVIRRREPRASVTSAPMEDRPRAADRLLGGEVLPLEIAANDPLIAYLQSARGAVDIENLGLDSPALHTLRRAGMKLVVPLVSQGELIGLLNLGPRLSEQDYAGDDRGLLEKLAVHAAPAVRVAQLVRQQEVEAQERERMQQELQVARLIQQTLLPKELPELPGWEVAAHYQPAQAVGGDFYDFIQLPGGQLGIIVGDVTDKGVPAALVMATTRSILRAACQQLDSPGQVLARVNDLLHPDIPPNMFVTCLYAVLDPAGGTLSYANAGHNLPYHRSEDGAAELRATGMPLGCMPGMTYEEKSVTLAPGDSVLFHSDGLVEAHNAQREMFGFPRLMGLVAKHPGGARLVDHLLAELEYFVGPDYEQEDDITLVTLNCCRDLSDRSARRPPSAQSSGPDGDGRRVLADFALASEPGNERQAVERVAEAVKGLRVPANRLQRLKTAVAEATMNAMEHGNKYRQDLPVSIRVLASEKTLSVEIVDHGGDAPIPEAEVPDLEAKLTGAQAPRGWGLFLIKNMVDDVRVTSDETHRTVELVLRLEGDDDVSESL